MAVRVSAELASVNGAGPVVTEASRKNGTRSEKRVDHPGRSVLEELDLDRRRGNRRRLAQRPWRDAAGVARGVNGFGAVDELNVDVRRRAGDRLTAQLGVAGLRARRGDLVERVDIAFEIVVNRGALDRRLLFAERAAATSARTGDRRGERRRETPRDCCATW